MSQQGIFSIAPDAQAGAQTANSNGSQPHGANGAADSPFTSVSNAPSQDSPFTPAQSPFQQTRPADGNESNDNGGSGIPQRRPEGQPSALGGGNFEAEAATSVQPSEEKNVFTPAADNAGGAFQMNGFPANAASQVMEAAPVSSAPAASPFVTVANDHNNYEVAKAGLEPQQDFAAVPPRYTPVEQQAQQSQQGQAYQATQPTQAAPPTAPVSPSRPADNPQPVEPQADVVQAAPKPAMQAAQAAPATEPAYPQLELRAIFGVDHMLDVSQILQRARTLPGIRNVAVVGQQEASALSNFRQAMQGMGFGDSNDMKLSSGGGTIDFLSGGGSTVAVLLEGGYAPGVQETLIIVAREIGKLA